MPMHTGQTSGNDRLLETILVIVTAVLACLMYFLDGSKIVLLNLFFLPVGLAGFCLGRYRAGVLALLTVIIATIVCTANLHHFGVSNSPVSVSLAIILWGSVLGLTALLVGTLSEDRDRSRQQAREADLGIVELLSRYLQASDPDVERRTKEIVRLSEEVAAKLRLTEKEIDDIRLAALLVDLENIEVTARAIGKAVGEMETVCGVEPRSFAESTPVRSLGSVVHGAIPILLSQTRAEEAGSISVDQAFGARILTSVRAYVQLKHGTWPDARRSPDDVLEELRSDIKCEHHPAVLHALEEIESSVPPDACDAVCISQSAMAPV